MIVCPSFRLSIHPLVQHCPLEWHISLFLFFWDDHRYLKTTVRTYVNKVYTKFRGLNVPEYDAECKAFRIISIDSLLVYENK